MSFGPAKRKRRQLRHDPLGERMTVDPGKLSKKSLYKSHSDEEMEEDVSAMDPRMSTKMLGLAREQIDEIDGSARKKRARTVHFTLNEEEDDYSEDEEEFQIETSRAMTSGDLAALELFAPESTRETKRLCELLGERIVENDRMRDLNDLQEELEKRMPVQFVQVFKDCAKILKTWKSGRLPKAFKIIPNLDNWEEVLQLTRPEDWSANTMYYASKMFSSNLKSLAAQRFFNCVLLPCVRDDIRENKRLNYHYYQAVRKALYKPKAFYRGFLIPLCQSGCTGREALILSGILAKKSIPRFESAAALYKLLELPYSGTTHLFIKILIDKKYALPTSVIRTLVNHFCKFQHDHRKMPVIWHQCLLVFVQRYKKSLTQKDKEDLRKLLRSQTHRQISDEVRRELASTKEEQMFSEKKFDFMEI